MPGTAAWFQLSFHRYAPTSYWQHLGHKAGLGAASGLNVSACENGPAASESGCLGWSPWDVNLMDPEEASQHAGRHWHIPV